MVALKLEEPTPGAQVPDLVWEAPSEFTAEHGQFGRGPVVAGLGQPTIRCSKPCRTQA